MGYKLRNGGIPHTRPQLCILTPRPLLQVLTVYPSLQVLTPSPHCVSFTRDPQSNPPIYILHSRPSIQSTNIYPSPETLTMQPYYVHSFSLYIGIHISVIYSPYTPHIHNTPFLLLFIKPPHDISNYNKYV